MSSRRTAIRQIFQTGLATGLSSTLAASPLGLAAPPVPKAKALIQVWLWGGASHLDTFDPKPSAGSDYSGPYQSPIKTTIPGLHLNESLPLLAKQAKRFSILRSLTHGVNGHETASYMVQTGHRAGDLVYPTVAATIAHLQGATSRGSHSQPELFPPYIVLTKAQGRFSESGFLGNSAKPFVTGGDPSQNIFAVEGLVAKGISKQRQQHRRDLLQSLDQLFPQTSNQKSIHEERNKAYEWILGSAGKVFDLRPEGDAVRERYGKNKFGQSCLAARRLVEAGARCVTINYQGWDTHKKHFESMKRKLPELDRGLSTLLEDLQQRGLLDSTVVWCSGEFGRTPKIQHESPWNGGRSHYGKAFSGLLAGGGFQGGAVIGATDVTGSEVSDRPIYPWDLTGSIYRQFGIQADTMLQHPHGTKHPLLPTADQHHTYGGFLDELV